MASSSADEDGVSDRNTGQLLRQEEEDSGISAAPPPAGTAEKTETEV